MCLTPRQVLLGIERRRSVWIEEEAADMLMGTWSLGDSKAGNPGIGDANDPKMAGFGRKSC